MGLRAARRAALVSAAIATIAVMATACVPEDERSASATSMASDADIEAALAKETHLTVWAQGPDMDDAAAAFESEYPAIDIEVLGSGGPYGDSATLLQVALDTGDYIPDLVEMTSGDVATHYVLSDDLADLTRFGASGLKSAFVPAAWNSVAYADGIWGLPIDVAPVVVAYRADILRAAGIDEFPKTWDEFAAASVTVKERTGSYLTTLGPDELQMLIGQDSPPLIDWDGGTEIGIHIANPSVERTANYWDGLLSRDLVLPGGALSNVDAVSPGSVASWIVPPWLAPPFVDGGVWRVAALPQWNPDAPSYVGDVGHRWVIPAQAESPLAAYAFVRWLTTEYGTVRTPSRPGAVPASVDALADVGWLSSESEFFGGQQVNRVLADTAQKMTFAGADPTGIWEWDFQSEIGPQIGVGALFPALREYQSTLIADLGAAGFTVATDGAGE